VCVTFRNDSLSTSLAKQVIRSASSAQSKPNWYPPCTRDVASIVPGGAGADIASLFNDTSLAGIGHNVAAIAAAQTVGFLYFPTYHDPTPPLPDV
jgi:hypothetical protein